ncbi:hypothetical protein PIROE2DRAFT_60456 [Piromyces sp. E2]|nr:hypothetical protein PIROE2DRAFT_60456 [Piromyces sp. E2]|eukprot:OUM64720.1 hypothetical protein PIROE2DRAFT_60456 [Piromyces sp. E2]
MERMGKLFSQIINKNNLGKKINNVMDKDYLYSIEKTIENLTGPHIAEVTTAAYTCGNLNFNVFGEGKFICHGEPDPSEVSILSIFTKVQMQAFFWGLGTAIGELPPYFVSRAAALAGQKNQSISKFEDSNEQKSFADKVQSLLFKFLKKLGFVGILLCASIPNPLFDIAGILCGHFLIPFGTFFGATFIGKALIKNTIQENDSGLVSTIWNLLITFMIAYFVFSIIESLAISEFNKVKEKELVKIVNDSKRNLKIRGPDEEVITELTNAAYKYINSNLNNFDKTASREDLRSEISIRTIIRSEEQYTTKKPHTKKSN